MREIREQPATISMPKLKRSGCPSPSYRPVHLRASKLFLILLSIVIERNDLCRAQSEADPLSRVPKFANHHDEELLPLEHRATTMEMQPRYRFAEEGGERTQAGPLHETANNRSIYSSLTKIIYELKNQLERQQQLSKRLDQGSRARPRPIRELDEKETRQNTSEPTAIPRAASSDQSQPLNLALLHQALSQVTQRPKTSDQPDGTQAPENTTTITVNSAEQPRPDESQPEPPTQATTVREKRIPSSGEHGLRDNQPQLRRQVSTATATKRPKSSGTRQPRWSTSSPKQQAYRSQQPLTFAPKLLTRPPGARTTARSSSYDTNDESDEPDENFASPFVDDPSRGSFSAANSLDTSDADDIRYRTIENSWSSPLVAVSSQHHQNKGQLSKHAEAAGWLDFQPTHRRHKQKASVESSPVRVDEHFSASSELVDPPQRNSDEEESVGQIGGQSARWPGLNPQGIHLERVYPHSSINSILHDQRNLVAPSPPSPAPILVGEQGQLNSRSGQLVSPSTSLGTSLYTRDVSSQPTSSTYATQQQVSAMGLAQQAPQRDLMNSQPQTIQITAVPNNGLVNGVLGGALNPLLRINTGIGPLGGQLVNGLWNNGLWNTDALGRPVMMVNAERRQVDWSFWIWPIILVATLPIVLGALFVPVFLKTVVILIQILQSLGLLIPLASALSQQVAHVSGVAASAVTGNNQLEHVQKEAPLT